MAVFRQAFVPKLIYVYRIDDEAHAGCLKIGEASCAEAGPRYYSLEPNADLLNKAAHRRIGQQTQTAGIAYELLYTEITASIHGKEIIAIQDHEVHAVLERSGIQRKRFGEAHKANEWFRCDLETAKRAIAAAKEGRSSLGAAGATRGQDPIEFRPEQREAIEKTVKAFRKKSGPRKMLWNAKMRFGKTLCALEVAKRCDMRRSLILTHRPVVDKGWFEDYGKIFYDRPEFRYGSKGLGDSLEELEAHARGTKTGSYIYFASIQDARGSEAVGGKFEKNGALFAVNWDLIIVDEAHEGTQTELGQKALAACAKKETRVLHLSGTPFNLMESFNPGEIFTWDYVMEQKAKAEWDALHPGDPNPYECLPRLNIFTYNLGELFPEFADRDIAFNFREFFRADGAGAFAHGEAVLSFLNLLCREDEASNYPFSTREYRENFRHSLWVVPGVKEARALSALLKRHPVFGAFEVVNVAGPGDEEIDGKNALKSVEAAIGPRPEETYTITLTCGRLTTGVSVKAWTACLMLSGSYSTAASSYMQTIFRVQTPAVIGGREKAECFVFDFAPDRTLKIIAEAAEAGGRDEGEGAASREALGRFLNFCPVISLEGSRMVPYDTGRLFGQLKKAYIERVVRSGFENSHLYNRKILEGIGEEELAKFDDLRRIIGSTKAMPKANEIRVNELGLTDEDHGGEGGPRPTEPHDPTEKEKRQKEARRRREAAISILRGISIRMPLLIYGADVNLALDGEEEALTLDNFANLVDEKSWVEFMPAGVTKAKFAEFKKYYDADVFEAAGKRIREMARAADALPVEERIERIASIFDTFRNPDKETVLTPWRVVNLHLAETLGGWCFYDGAFEKRLEEPRHVAGAQGVAAFAPSSKILEINSKSGLYALYCAYAIYRSRLELRTKSSELRAGEKQGASGGESEAMLDCAQGRMSHDEEAALWARVLDENVYVICKTPMAKSIARRTLAGFRELRVNARCIGDLAGQLRQKGAAFAENAASAAWWKKESEGKMDFDAVVGNPPYQEVTEGTSDNPVYHLFIEAAYKLAPRASLIHPARFLFNAGKTPKEWNEKMLHDPHLKVVRYWAKSGDVFPMIDIKGGVAITYRDANKDFGEIGTFTAFEELNSIIKKAAAKTEAMSLASIMYAQSRFNLEALYSEYPEAKNEIGSGGKERRLTTNIFSKMPFFTEKREAADDIEILGLISNKRVWKFIPRRFLDASQENLNKWKVLVPAANGSGALGEVLSTPLIGQPLIGHTQSFISIGAFNTQEEAESCLKYVKTKFARCLLGVLKATQHNTPEKWLYVPLQDFSAGSDIDWTQPVAEADARLYKKYGLSQEEVSFIESRVKAM